MSVRRFYCTLTQLMKLVFCAIFGWIFVVMMSIENEYQPTQIEAYLNDRLYKIKQSCSDVCKINSIVKVDNIDVKNLGVKGNYKNLMIQKKNIDCAKLFEDSIHDEPAPSFQMMPFEAIPKKLLPEFTYENKILVKRYFFTQDFPRDRKKGISTTYWDKKWIKKSIQLARNAKWDDFGGTYGAKESKLLYNTLLENDIDVQGKSILVIGSINPWVESIFLSLGANNTVTLEYNKIVSNHPQTKTYLPWELSRKYLSGDFAEKFDIAISYSSIEHAGLGRFGDALHPWGDLVTMAKTWCLVKPGGSAIIAVPTAKEDTIEYNAHRCYGQLLLTNLFANWILKFSVYDFASRIPYCDHTQHYMHNNTIFVLQKPFSTL